MGGYRPFTFLRPTGRVLLGLLATVSVASNLTACDHEQPTVKVIVLVASATRNEPAAVLAPPDLADLRQAAVTSDAIAYVVDTNTGQPTTVTLTPLRPDGQVEYGPDRNALLAANLAQVQRLLARQAADHPFDLLSLLAQAVKVSPVPGTLIVVSSGLSTAGGFDLRQVGWYASPVAVASQLKREGFLPSLTKWHVIFSGLGDTAGDQPALPLPQQAELVAYIMAICHAAGAASCGTDDVTRPDPPAASSYRAPVVPVPVVTSVQGPRGWTGENIPADLFFRLNSSQLLPGADSILGPLAARAKAYRLQVSITGSASPETGSPAYNQALSLARARSIQAGLIALGVAPDQIIQVAGDSTAGKTAAVCYRDGHLDEVVCAKLRRVVILLSPVPNSTT
jgi:outer membrane protein OmpA-like peptidoglycan-associated protein